ncbi:MAG: alpha/beta fold hydrolase [Chloroflexota bacterium]|nr:alpha/beta fold hydrolase [Chloroflexota bacterium]
MFDRAFGGEEHRPFTLTGSNGAAVVLVHGFPGTPFKMRPLADALHADGWTAHAPLLPGFGSGIARLDSMSMSDWQGAIACAIETLRRDHDRLLLLGHSMGGALSIAVAAAQPPDRLLLIAPFWELDSPLWKLLPILSPVIREIKPFSLTRMNFNDPETRAGIRQFMPDADLDDPQVQDAIVKFPIKTRIFDQVRRVGQAGYDAAPTVTAPTLVLQGDADDLVKPGKTRVLAGRLRAQYIELPGPHNINEPRYTSWERVKGHVLTFARALAPVTAHD